MIENRSVKSSGSAYQFLGLALICFVASFALSYVSYFFQSLSGFNSSQALASFIFWTAILALALRFPLRSIVKSFAGYVRSMRGFLIFTAYLSVHLVVYGFILETIVASLYPAVVNFSLQPYLSISALPLRPIGPEGILLGFFVYPNVTLTILPFLGASLSLYSIVMAIIIGVLVTTNIKKAIELRDACSRLRKSSAFVALPVLGVVGGASCCLSLPLFITLFAPAAALSYSYQVAYYVTYFLFPPITALALTLNLSSINKISNRITTKAMVT